MKLLDPLPIIPFTNPVQGEISLPGSKSITNRALLLASLCKKPVVLHGALFSEDTTIMAKALNDLGYDVTLDEAAGTMRVAGQATGFCREGAVELFVGNAGTAARFLTALCAAAPQGTYVLSGIPQMHHRPMRGLIDALRSLGADIRCQIEEGFLPIEIHAKGLRGGDVSIDASESSQMLSALLMVMCLAKEPCEIRRTKAVREPFVNMTLLMIRQFGFNAGSRSDTGTLWTIPADPPRGSLAQSGGSYSIEADASSASYYLALPTVVNGTLTLLNMPFPHEDLKANLQGDGYNFIRVMKQLGATVSPYVRPQKRSLLGDIFSWFSLESSAMKKGQAMTRPDGVIVSDLNPHRNKGLLQQEFKEFSDTFLTLAAITPILSGRKTTITGIAHTRKQETDRVKAMANELIKIIGKECVRETDDSLEISAMTKTAIAALKRRMVNLKDPLLIETYNDHRIAMSFAILGCYDLKKNGKPWISIKNPSCCAKTFPNFFDVLKRLRANAHIG